MSRPDSHHPDREQLRAFGLGLLSADEQKPVEQHLLRCAECGRVVRDQSDDWFVGLVKQATLAGPPTVPLDRNSPPGGGPGSGRVETVGPDVRSTQSDQGSSAIPSGESAKGQAAPSDLFNHPRYRILERIGAGGMGTVYRAEHRRLHRILAGKVINSDRLSRPEAVERFHREAELAAQLSHPNIVTVIDADQAGDTHFMAEEFVEGTTLAEWVLRHGPLATGEACRYALQVALGLQHAHEHGLVHRDIKPGNLLRTVDGQIKIADFGLARLVGDGTIEGLTAENEIMGTADYVAPEQIADARTCDIRADLYSLGCTLYFLLTGQPPFAGMGLMEKLKAHAEKPPPRLTDRRSDVDPNLARLVARVTAKKPEARFQTPRQVAEALAPFADGGESLLGPPSRSGLPSAESAARARNPGGLRASPVAAAALALLLLGAGGVGAFVYHLRTAYGELVISTTEPDVEVIVSQDGRQVSVLDPKTQTRVRLRPGQYQLRPGGRVGEVTVWPESLTIERGGRVIARIEAIPSPPTTEPSPLPSPRPDRPARGLGEELPTEGRLLVGQSSVNDAVFLPDGRHAVTAGRGPDMVLWNIREGREVRRFQSHPDIVWAVAVSPDGRLAATGGQDKSGQQDFGIRLWDLDSGRELRRLVGHTEIISGLAFTPDGKRLVSTGWDRALRFWEVETGKLVSTQTHTEPLTAVAVSMDGRRIATGTTSGPVLLWDAGAGIRLTSLVGHAVPSGALSFLPDSHGLLSAPTDGEDAVALLWDIDTGRPRRMLRGHAGHLLKIVSSPDGRLAATGSVDGTVRLWDLSTGREVRRYAGYRGPVGAIAFAPDGHSLLAGSLDGTLRLWPVPRSWDSAQARSEAPEERPLARAVEVLKPSSSDGSGQVLRFRAPKDRIGHAAFTADGKGIVFGGDQSELEDPRRRFRRGRSHVEGPRGYGVGSQPEPGWHASGHGRILGPSGARLGPGQRAHPAPDAPRGPGLRGAGAPGRRRGRHLGPRRRHPPDVGPQDRPGAAADASSVRRQRRQPGRLAGRPVAPGRVARQDLGLGPGRHAGRSTAAGPGASRLRAGVRA
jgi:eukaryotic-like serine/threonine-protein kinase